MVLLLIVERFAHDETEKTVIFADIFVAKFHVIQKQSR